MDDAFRKEWGCRKATSANEEFITMLQATRPPPSTSRKNRFCPGAAHLHAGGGEYAIDILKVQEIRGYDGDPPSPTRRASSLAVINLRGTIVPIVDLRIVLGRGLNIPSTAVTINIGGR